MFLSVHSTVFALEAVSSLPTRGMMGGKIVSGWVPVMPAVNLIELVLIPAISGFFYASAGSAQHSVRPWAVLGQGSVDVCS